MPIAEFHRKSLLFAGAFFTLVCPLGSQNPSSPLAAPSFDVATIKLHEGMLSVTGLINRPDGINASAATLSEMVAYAFGVRSEGQVSGGPAWAATDRYDVEAKMSAEDAASFQKLTSAEMKECRAQMLRSLLEDRFKLQAHLVTKDVPVYELVVAKGGSRLRDSATDKDDHLRMGKDGKPIAGVMWFLKDTCMAQGYSMGSLAEFLSQPFAGLGRPVLDETGLAGTYYFKLDWSPQMKATPGGLATASAPSDDAPSIFTALQELGLKLQPATGPEKTVVIDHVERPTRN